MEVTGSNASQKDGSFLGIGSIRVVHDLGSQAGHQAFASFDYFLQEQNAVDSLDISSYSAEAGASLKIGTSALTPSLRADNILLSRETFLRTQGGKLRLDHPLNDKLSFFTSGEWTREDYTGISENTVAEERKGHRATAEIGGVTILNPTMRLELKGSYIAKYAKAAYYEYDGFAAQAGHTWLLGKGQFLTNILSYEADLYDDPDFAISARTRRDEQYRYRMTYGAPVSLFIGKKILPPVILENLTALGIFEQFRSTSTVQNYTYRNSKVAVLLTKTVEF